MPSAQRGEEALQRSDSTPEQSTDAESTPRRDVLATLPPSSKLVAKVLEIDGELTQSEIADESLLPTRTVRLALNRLEEADAVDSRPCLRDARKRVYFLVC